MDDGRVSAFGGVAGRILSDSMSIGTAATGVVLAVAIFGVSFLLGMVGGTLPAQIVTQVILAVALARFALNAMAGETRGTVFSTAGGPWSHALAVAGRYLTL